MDIAIIKNGKVINIVEGEPETVAELFEQTAPVTDKTGIAWIGARYNGEKFEPKVSYSSWTWNEETFSYDPPKPKPEGNYFWDEKSLEWLPVPEKTEPTDTEA